MGNPKNAAWYGSDLASVMIPGAGLGNVFYNDGCGGDDANDGLSPQTPKLTLTASLAQCTNDMNDTIVVLDYYQPAGETWPVDINKSKVNIIGTPSGSFRCWACVDSVGDTACFSVNAHDVIIRNFLFDAGASHAGIEFANNKGRMGIYDCYFATGAYGVMSAAGGIEMGLEVSNCFFQQSLTAQGIYINDDPAFIKLHDNVFDRVQGVAIEVVQGGAPQILNNVIALPSNTAGMAITLGASVTRAIVNGNSANYGDTDMGNIPYTDGAGAGANSWLLNYQGTTAVQPN